VVPSFIHGPSPPCPSHGGSPHACASVASMLTSAANALCPLMHEDRSGSSALDLTMSFWPSSSAAVVPPVVPSAVVPPAAPVLPPVLVPAPPVIDLDSVGDSTLPIPAPVLIICSAEPFKLLSIADAIAYLNLSNIIQYYLRCPEFSTQSSDNALMTDSRNAKVSAYWEGQVRVVIQDGSLYFLFEHKGSMYDGKGFEMLAALNQHCRPNSVANAFTTLMSFYNNSMGESEEIMAFLSRFDGKLNDMSHCKIILPLVLMVMFFLHSLHSCYGNLLEQFCSRDKFLIGASLDSVVADVRYHNEFKLVGSDKKCRLERVQNWRLPPPLLLLTNKERSGATPTKGLLALTSKALRNRGRICLQGMVYILSDIVTRTNMPQPPACCWLNLI
jgi:hypothetical protein